MNIILSVAIGGALGAVLRYVISGSMYSLFGTMFPYGTFIVNMIGSFLIGFLWEFFNRIVISSTVKVLVLTGMIGAFTTFSTYMLESLNLYRDGKVKIALLNILLSNIGGIILVICGITASRFLFFLIEKRI